MPSGGQGGSRWASGWSRNQNWSNKWAVRRRRDPEAVQELEGEGGQFLWFHSGEA